MVGSIAASLLAAIALVVGGRRAGADREPDAEAPTLAETVPADAAPASADAAPASVAGGDQEDQAGTGSDGSVSGQREPATAVIPAARVGADEPAVLEEARERDPSVVVPESVIPAQGGASGRRREFLLDNASEATDDEDPPDEPVAQRVPDGDAAEVARMSNEVLVIDGRPRYHLAGCVHLLGRTSEPLPVSEAVELGFTPCGLCEPDRALLAEARGV
nr:hypothetical protein [Planosporangium flavigriseum]